MKTTIESLYDFATPETIKALLVKERIKCCKKNRKQNEKCRNRNDRNHPRHFDYSDHLDEPTDNMSIRIGINFIMPPRSSWRRPSHKVRQDTDKKTLLTQSLLSTLKRDEDLYSKLERDEAGNPIFDERAQRLGYIQRLNDYVDKIRKRFKGESMHLNAPDIEYILKKKDDRNNVYEYRPIAVYEKLDDKIILSITSKYLAKYMDNHLHENILSYRPKRRYNGKDGVVTDFNTGIVAIGEYRKKMGCSDIYVSDCDIKKFYDTINHDVVEECFDRILEEAEIKDEARRQVMMVLDAYLESYDFYTNVFLKTQERVPGQRVRRDVATIVKWVSDEDFAKCYGSKTKFEKARDERKIGVPQGGALSLLIANIVLNDIDKQVMSISDEKLFFCRFCDDMVMMYPELEKCTAAKNEYEKQLKAHYLVFHDFTDISKLKDGDLTKDEFWEVKSHSPYLWGKGSEGHNWVGFLGYEMNRAGHIRLRMSNVLKFEAHIRRTYHSLYRQYHKGFTNEWERASYNSKLKKARKMVEDSELYKSYTAITDTNASDELNCVIKAKKSQNSHINAHLRHQIQRIAYSRKLFLFRKIKDN